MTITNLNTFVSGTVASVTPMNENFETIRLAVNSVEQTVTNNRTYLDNKVIELEGNIQTAVKDIKTQGEIFCVNKGPFNNQNQPEILTVSGTDLSFATPFTATNHKGTVVGVESADDISLAGYSDGKYNVFVDTDGNSEIIKNEIYRQSTEPTAIIGTIWADTSKSPLVVQKYTSEGWEEFLKVPIGSFEVSSGTIQNVKTNSYNQNGYNLNIESGYPMPDYSKGVSKTNGVTYTAECAGWIKAYSYAESGVHVSSIKINGTSYTLGLGQFTGYVAACGNAVFIPVAKGTVYIGTQINDFAFYPAITC